MKKIGILITGHVRDELVPEHGEYSAFFERFIGDGYQYRSYFVVDDDFPEQLDHCDAYLLTGSAYGAYEDHAFIPRLEVFIREVYAAGVPLVGVCFGHQIMAQALGGKVEKFAGGWGLGVQAYEMDLGDGLKTVRVNAVHQDQVVEAPSGARVIGSNDFCAHAALAYDKAAISFQPHPEFYPRFMEDLITLRKGKSFSAEAAEAALLTLGEETDNDEIAAFIRAFLDAHWL